MGRRQHSERYIDMVMEDGRERTARQVLDEIINQPSMFQNIGRFATTSKRKGNTKRFVKVGMASSIVCILRKNKTSMLTK